MFQKILSELPSGLEPPTSSLPRMRATYCAKAACDCSQMVFYHRTNAFVNREFNSFRRLFFTILFSHSCRIPSGRSEALISIPHRALKPAGIRFGRRYPRHRKIRLSAPAHSCNLRSAGLPSPRSQDREACPHRIPKAYTSPAPDRTYRSFLALPCLPHNIFPSLCCLLPGER